MCQSTMTLIRDSSASDGFHGIAVAVGRQMALHTENSGCSLHLWVSTFPRFVAI